MVPGKTVVPGLLGGLLLLSQTLGVAWYRPRSQQYAGNMCPWTRVIAEHE